MDNRAALRDAVMGGAQLGAGPSPLGNFPELAGLYQSNFALPAVQAASQASGFNTGITVDNQAAAAKEAKANAIDAMKLKVQQLQDLQDASKYTQQPKEDGGFAFYDPSGKEITASEYAHAVGKQPHDVLKDSQNPIDQGFNQDYKQLQDYMTAKRNAKGDPNGAGLEAKKIEDIVKKTQKVDLAKMNPIDVINRFQQAYPTVFGLKKKGISPNQSFIPNKNAIPTSSGGGSVSH